MKKYLLLILLLCGLCIFINSCGDIGEESRTEEQTTTAITTSDTTTAVAKATTTLITTTVPPEELLAKLPQKLPDGSGFSVVRRFGLEGADEFLTVDIIGSASYEPAGVYGNGYKYNQRSDMPFSGRSVDPKFSFADPFSAEGIKGILLYLDMSAVESKPDSSLYINPQLNGNAGGESSAFHPSQSGYYYSDSEWKRAGGGEEFRSLLPDKFKGWIYLPLSLYENSKDGGTPIYISATGVGSPEVVIERLAFYCDGYIYQADEYLVLDELLFVG